MIKVLTKKKLSTFLKAHSEWSTNPKQTELRRTCAFTNYIDGLVIIARIAVHAEILNHHPDILFQYGKLRITLKTHSPKGLTKLDTALAERIDKILKV